MSIRSLILALVSVGLFKVATCALPTVTIDAGVIIGTTASPPVATAPVNKFLGIPFAVSPPERFAPPQPPEKWETPLEVKVVKPVCIQQFNYPEATRNTTIATFNNPAPEESEDCMYLNVWSPTTSPPHSGWPVLFWLFGGALQFGGGGLPGYDGSNFAAYENVIVVTTNYRTNVFGFPRTEELPLRDRNPGFLDQRAALDWIQRNIEKFGGDKEKVTIFGESAGGVSVDALLSSWPLDSKPPFRAGIMQSGQSSHRAKAQSLTPTNSDSFARLAAGLNCTGNATLACVRKAPVLFVKNVMERNALSFGSIVDNYTMFGDIPVRRRKGLIHKLPIMIGSNAQEQRITLRGNNNLTAYLEKTYPNLPELHKALIAAYPVGTGEFATEFDAVVQIATDAGQTCTSAIYANASTNARHTAFRYFYNASFPNIRPIKGYDSGVYHASEIQMVFGNHGRDGPSTPQQTALSNFMLNAWANFARNPTRGPGWPAVGSAEDDVAVIGNRENVKTSGITLVKQSVVDSRCEIFKPLYNFVN